MMKHTTGQRRTHAVAIVAVACLSLLLAIQPAEAFLIPHQHHSIHNPTQQTRTSLLHRGDPTAHTQTTNSALSMAKSATSNKSKKKKSTASSSSSARKNKKSSSKKEKSKSPGTAGAANAAASQIPSQKSRAPPWQVLSKKEADKNVHREKLRREQIKQGVLKPSEEQPLEDSINNNSFDDDNNNKRSLSKALLSDADRLVIGWKRFNPHTAPAGVTFIGSYLNRRLPPRLGVPEIAFLGRSNVGKSSLLNRLTRRAATAAAPPAASASATPGADKSKRRPAPAQRPHGRAQARVGKTPGATASVNLYALWDARARSLLGLADLPGFGYAKLSKETQEAVQEAAERYLGKRQELALGILLVDARRVPSEEDCGVLAALYDMGLPIVVVATKADKLSKNELGPALARIRDKLGLPEGQPLCVSSVTGEGTKQLWSIILDACETKVEEMIDVLNKAGSDGQRGGLSDGDDEEMYGAIQLDEDGNLLLPDDDGKELSYSQGYDWIQAQSVMYDYNNRGDEEKGGDGGYGYDEVDDDGIMDWDDQESPESGALNLKDLKKQVRSMERKGQV